MRKINKNFNNIPQELQICASKNELDLIENKTIKSECYKKARTELEELYHGKCAYCETKYLATSSTWIEHYRPKSKYYWLAYEWSNLLPTCEKCNRTKKDNFPIANENKRVTAPLFINKNLDKNKNRINNSPLIDENPLILNPEIDDPEKCLTFDIDENKKGIKIIGIDEKGKITIKICDLNRVDLIIDRQQQVIDELIKSFNKIFSYLEKNLLPEEKLYEALKIDFENLIFLACKEELEFTLLRKIILNSPENFEKIICPYIPDLNYRKIILKSFKKFKI